MGVADRDHAELPRRPTDGVPDPAADWSRRRRGAWDCAADWAAVWISFGESWYRGAEPLPWAAHAALWDKLGEYADHTRYRLGLGGVPSELVRRRVEI